jgi:hypothetical protein
MELRRAPPGRVLAPFARSGLAPCGERHLESLRPNRTCIYGEGPRSHAGLRQSGRPDGAAARPARARPRSLREKRPGPMRGTPPGVAQAEPNMHLRRRPAFARGPSTIGTAGWSCGAPRQGASSLPSREAALAPCGERHLESLRPNRLSVFGFAESGPVRTEHASTAKARVRTRAFDSRDGRMELRRAPPGRVLAPFARSGPAPCGERHLESLRPNRLSVFGFAESGPVRTEPASTAKARVRTRAFDSRDGRIRTGDPLNPIQVRYRAAPRPEVARSITGPGIPLKPGNGGASAWLSYT